MSEGRVLAGRYRLEGLIGRGGMAEVWAARDDNLDRPVAVKVMSSRYLDDDGFRQRFAEEAHRSANLNHPNIVQVYDTGSDDDQPFFVMELVDGRSLAEAIEAGGLTESRALEVVADVCLALQHAHDRGLVHRDIKPGNILLADDGTVKVSDFGIARAIDSDTVTRTAAVLGTAAYLSPEQAQALEVDARSDIYALGVVLYELLTGYQPFSGGSPVTVAYQHVQEQPRPPRDWDESVSPAAEAITIRALAKNPANRYQTAAEMRDDLLNARAGRGVTAPAVLAASDTALLDAPTGTRPVRGARQEHRRRALVYVLVGLLTVAATIGAVWLLITLLTGEEVPTITVPNVVDLPLNQAEEVLSARGLAARTTDQVTDPEAEPGIVLTQDPEAGTEVEDGATVGLVISLGREQVAVPPVVGLPEEEALAVIRDVGLTVGDRTPQADDEVEEGVVLGTSPEAGTMLASGSTVDYVVSTGQATTQVPPLVRLPEAQAILDIEEQGLTVGDVSEEFHPTVPEGAVIEQDPAPGETVTLGSPVDIVLSLGPEPPPSPSPTPTPSPTPSPEPTPDPTQSPTASPTADGDGGNPDLPIDPP